MAKFTKTALKVGTYRSPDGEVNVTTERLRHWQEQFKRMKAANQVVPIDWDHAEEASALQPMSLKDWRKKRSSQDTVGLLDDFALSSDGKSAIVTLDVRDPKAIQRANENAVYISPVLFPSWADGAGNDYQDVITHVDFVNHPVDHSQSEFTPAEPGVIACAIRMALSKPYRLSETTMAEKTIELEPYHGFIRMGSDDPADGFFTKNGKTIPITVGGEDYLDDDHKAASPSKKWKGRGSKSRKGRKGKGKKMSLVLRMSEDTEPMEADVIGEDDTDMVDEVLDLLEENGVVLPEDTTDENLVSTLRVALTAVNGKNIEDPDDEPEDEGEPMEVQEPSISTMSLTASKALAYAEQQHQSSVQGRLDALLQTGRCTPAEHRDKKNAVDSVKLSLTKEGKPKPSTLEQWIEARVSVPAGTFWSDEQKIKMSAVTEPPAHLKGELNDDEVNATATWALTGKRK